MENLPNYISLLAQLDDLSNTYFIKVLMATIFWVGGFAAAPVIFMATMGIFRNITGMSSSLSKGLRGKMMARGNTARERGTQYKMADKNAAKDLRSQKRAGSYAQRRLGVTAAQRARRDTANDAALMTRSDDVMKGKTWQGHMFKDDVMKALTYNNEAEARAAGITDTGTLQAANQIGYGRVNQIAAARQLAMNKTGYADSADAMDTMRRVSGGNRSMEDSLRENVKYISKGVGRNDLGGLERMNDEEAQMVADGRGEDAREAWNTRMTLKGAETADGASLARNHNKSTENIARAVGSATSSPTASPEIQAKAGKVAAAMKDSETFATLGNTEQIDSAARAADQTGGAVGPGLRPFKASQDPDSLLNQQSRGRRSGGPDDPRNIEPREPEEL